MGRLSRLDVGKNVDENGVGVEEGWEEVLRIDFRGLVDRWGGRRGRHCEWQG